VKDKNGFSLCKKKGVNLNGSESEVTVALIEGLTQSRIKARAGDEIITRMFELVGQPVGSS